MEGGGRNPAHDFTHDFFELVPWQVVWQNDITFTGHGENRNAYPTSDMYNVKEKYCRVPGLPQYYLTVVVKMIQDSCIFSLFLLSLSYNSPVFMLPEKKDKKIDIYCLYDLERGQERVYHDIKSLLN